jgi:hypothetical protein
MFAVNAAPFNNELNSSNNNHSTRARTIRKRELFTTMNTPTKAIDYKSELTENNNSEINEQYKLPVQQKNIESLIQRLHNSSDDFNDNLSDFNPPPKPSSVGAQRRENKDTNKYKNSESDEPITVEGFNNISNQTDSESDSDNESDNKNTLKKLNNLNNYYKQFNPSYFSNTNFYGNKELNTLNNPNDKDNVNNKELIQKLNYMINLLEEQKDEKTGHVTEEIILYSFLGIFIIFVIDSFARASKYVR